MAGEVTVIAPTRGWQPIRFRDLWRFRDLGYFFVWRELKVRYKQTLLGASWAIVQPALMTVIFAVIFGRLADVPSGDIPYPLFAFVALVPWTFFSQGVTQGVRSLTGSVALISRVYFPRLLLPLASVASFLLDLAVTTVLALVLMLAYGYEPTATILLLPAFLALLLVTTSGIAFLLSASGAQYRDVQFVIPFLIQIWLFVTPVVYSLDLIPEEWRAVYALNPMATTVEGFRLALLGESALGALEAVVSVVAAIAIFVG